VASYSAGIEATWGGVAFGEVYDLSFSYGGGTPKGRDSIWSDELGSVTLSCYGSANISTSEWGQRKELSISGGGASLTNYAICESIAVQYGLNDVTRFTVTFKLTDN
jgi:hypothetical protein